MRLQRPNAVVTLEGQSYSAAEAALVRLCASFSVLGSHDFVELRIWPSSKLASAPPGSKLSIALGDSGSETDVWSGEIAAVEAASDRMTITGFAATVALSRTRTSQTYLDQSIADIVRDLASAVDIDQVEGDLNLPAYAVDDRRSVWAYLNDLAAIAGAEVGANPAGALRFVSIRSGSADLTLRAGADVIAWHAANSSTPDAPSVAAYGAASEAGADQWHWILSSPSPQGSGPFTRIPPPIRTRDAADGMAQVLAARAARAGSRGRLAIVGRADLRPGDLIEIASLPGPDPGTLRVTAVDHLLDPLSGFTTAVTVEGAAS
jgi:hypothetical protein